MVQNQTGSAFGSYYLLRPVGWGGMSVVYHALQPDSSADVLAPGNVTEVAVKIMNTHKEDALNFYRRFQREVRVASALTHPHILPVCDFGIIDEQLYLVTPFMAHGTLEHRLKERKLLTLNEAIILLTQIGQALDYAHSQNIVHRDVKPHNIMVGRDNRYYLTDFGLVKILDGSTRLTMSGRIIGTPAYMSPEQASGADLDHRTDIYSLGIVLYECLVGRLPYMFETQSQAIGQHLSARAIAPRRINPRFPAAVERVLLRALEKDPSRRFASASELLAALEKAAKLCPESMRDCPLVTPEQIQQSRTVAATSSKSWIAPRKAPVSMWGFAGALVLSLAIVFGMRSGSLNFELLVDALNFEPTSEGTETIISPSAESSPEDIDTPEGHSITSETAETGSSHLIINQYAPITSTRPVPDDFAPLEMVPSYQETSVPITPTYQKETGNSQGDALVDEDTETAAHGNGVGNGNANSSNTGNNGGGTENNNASQGNGTGNDTPGNGNGGGNGSTVDNGNGNGQSQDQPAETGNGNGNANDKPDKTK